MAQVTLARRYWTEDVKEYEKAFELYQRSAEQKCVKGLYGLAVMYYLGLGRNKDVEKAWQYLEPCINMGDTEARRLFATMCMNNDMQEILPDKAIRGLHYLELASINGSKGDNNADGTE